MGNTPGSKFDGHYSHVFPIANQFGHKYSTQLPPGTQGVLSKKDWKWCAETINAQMPSGGSSGMLWFSLFLGSVLLFIGASQKIAVLLILGVMVYVGMCLAAFFITSSVTQGLHSACVQINERLNGSVEVDEYSAGKHSMYYLKIDVVRLKELQASQKEKAAKEEKPPSYEITVLPIAPPKETNKSSAGTESTSSTTSSSKADRLAQITSSSNPYTTAERMMQIKKLRDDGIISEREYKSAWTTITRA